MAETAEKTRGVRKERKGVVISRSGDKSIVVRVSRRRRHPLYGKVVTESTKLHAHDEGNVAKVGDTVRISEMRPTSRLKRWRLLDVVSGA